MERNKKKKKRKTKMKVEERVFFLGLTIFLKYSDGMTQKSPLKGLLLSIFLLKERKKV